MSRRPDIKRIRKEDFDPEYHGLIDKLSYSFNTFMDQVIFLFDNNIDFLNLNQQIVDYTISTDSTGELINPPNIRSTLNRKIQGITCIKATNILDPNVYPISPPWVSFDFVNNTTINVLNISGLQADSEYSLKLLLYGSD